MPRMLPVVLVLSVLWLTLTPFVTWGAKAATKHDCRQERPKGSYYCERGPLAGKRFASRKAMVQALQKSSNAELVQRNGKAAAGSHSKVKARAK